MISAAVIIYARLFLYNRYNLTDLVGRFSFPGKDMRLAFSHHFPLAAQGADKRGILVDTDHSLSLLELFL